MQANDGLAVKVYISLLYAARAPRVWPVMSILDPKDSPAIDIYMKCGHELSANND